MASIIPSSGRVSVAAPEFRSRLAERLMAGAFNAPPPVRTQGEAVFNGINRFAQMMMAKRLMGEEQERKDAASATMAQALKASKPWIAPDDVEGPNGGIVVKEGQPAPGTGGMEGMAAALMGNRDTAPLALQMQMNQIGEETRLAREAAIEAQKYKRNRGDKLEDTKAEREFKERIEKMKGDRGLREAVDKMMAEDKLARDRIDYEKGMGGGTAQPAPAPGAPKQESRVGPLGVPLADTDPLADLPISEKGKFAAKLREEAIKQFAKNREGVDQAANVKERLERFVTLLDQGMDTGGQYAIPGSQFLGSAVSPEVSEAKSIVDMMTPMMRQGMPGAASDRDVSMFRGATVGLDKPEEANRNIAAGLIASRQNLIERDQFLQSYFDQNKHLQGADRAWQAYLNANPIFDPEAPEGSYALNKKRRGWVEFFSNPTQDAPSSAAPQGWSIKRVN